MNQDEVIRFFTVEKNGALKASVFLDFYQHERLIPPHEIKYLFERG
ncbi:MAG: hypothetical protein IPM82_32710 [Saprospiraceae bacterium]|nr:hypothetical protein [Saprospiraceae bacterium]